MVRRIILLMLVIFLVGCKTVQEQPEPLPTYEPPPRETKDMPEPPYDISHRYNNSVYWALIQGDIGLIEIDTECSDRPPDSMTCIDNYYMFQAIGNSDELSSCDLVDNPEARELCQKTIGNECGSLTGESQDICRMMTEGDTSRCPGQECNEFLLLLAYKNSDQSICEKIVIPDSFNPSDKVKGMMDKIYCLMLARQSDSIYNSEHEKVIKHIKSQVASGITYTDD